MKPFSKQEKFSLLVIFTILILVSWPNFSLSLRRSRDQIRRDDIGNIQAAIDSYYIDYGMFPPSTTDGKIVACKASGSESLGPGGVDLIPCDWGHDPWINLTPGVSKTYMKVIPNDPNSSKGAKYLYFSDGSRYQLFAAMEGIDEPSYDSKLSQRNVMCGNKACNIGRANNVPMYITIDEYNLQIYCGDHPKDILCIK